MAKTLSTDRQITGLKALVRRYERAVSGARGLSVLVYANGTKTFVVRYVADNGRRRRLVLGDYPGLSLAEARLQVGALRVGIVGGDDPVAERAGARAAARVGETLAELADAYFKAAAKGLHGGRRRPKRPRTLEKEQGAWRLHIEPKLGRLRFIDIKRKAVKGFMRDLALSHLSPATVANIGGVLSSLLAFAVNEDMLEANPAYGLTRPLALESRTRLFKDNSLSLILITLQEASRLHTNLEGRDDPHARMGPTMALALRFLILTLTRRTETAGARWTEIDAARRTWTIPAERSKSNRIHVVPLSRAAMDILELCRRLPGANGEFIFPSPTQPGQHLEAHAVTRAVARICQRLQIAPGSPHDFRRSGATTLTGEEYGIRRFIVGKVLGHTAQDGAAVTSVYDRNEYLAEKRAALEAWARHVAGLMAPEAVDRAEAQDEAVAA